MHQWIPYNTSKNKNTCDVARKKVLLFPLCDSNLFIAHLSQQTCLLAFNLSKLIFSIFFSAPSKPMGEIPELRMRLAAQNLPAGFGIDPCTGQICGGDPSLILNTNIVMGEKKKSFLAAASKALASGLGKPESYVAVSVSDGLSMVFGGSEEPCALACCYSLGAINQANNKAVTAKVSALLAEFGIPSNRIYINFFDVPAANIGYGGATFAG